MLGVSNQGYQPTIHEKRGMRRGQPTWKGEYSSHASTFLTTSPHAQILAKERLREEDKISSKKANYVFLNAQMKKTLDQLHGQAKRSSYADRHNSSALICPTRLCLHQFNPKFCYLSFHRIMVSLIPGFISVSLPRGWPARPNRRNPVSKISTHTW